MRNNGGANLSIWRHEDGWRGIP